MKWHATVYVQGGVWQTPPVEEEPVMPLARWSIWEVVSAEKTTRHFVGRNMIAGEGRVSSHIDEFDAQTLRGRTKSGRLYELVGPPGYDGDGDYVFGVWLKVLHKTSWREITHELLPDGKHELQ